MTLGTLNNEIVIFYSSHHLKIPTFIGWERENTKKEIVWVGLVQTVMNDPRKDWQRSKKMLDGGWSKKPLSIKKTTSFGHNFIYIDGHLWCVILPLKGGYLGLQT